MPAGNQGAAQLIGGPPPTGNSSHTGPSWFQGAPLTKLLAVGTVAFYVMFHAKSSQDGMVMDSYRMLRATQFPGSQVASSSQWHRYYTSKFTFASTGELVMGGTLTTVLARQYEREMGTRKFGVFFLLVNISAMLMELVFVVPTSTLLMDSGGSYRYQGPYALLGGMMYLFHKFSPRLHPRFFGILGFTFSEKSFYYLWFAQVVGYGGWNTITATSLGFFTAYGYILLNLHETIDLPDAIAKPLTAIGAHLSEPPPRVLAPNTRGARGGGGGGGGGGGRDDPIQRLLRNNMGQQAAAAAAAAQRPVAPPAPPDPAAIEQLTSMGFERQQVINALQATNNNVERAADRLLSG